MPWWWFGIRRRCLSRRRALPVILSSLLLWRRLRRWIAMRWRWRRRTITMRRRAACVSRRPRARSSVSSRTIIGCTAGVFRCASALLYSTQTPGSKAYPYHDHCYAHISQPLEPVPPCSEGRGHALKHGNEDECRSKASSKAVDIRLH